MLNRLTDRQLDSKLSFIKNYIAATNAANGSLVDANANVTVKTMATLEAELHKFENIQVNRKLVCEKLTNMYGKEMSEMYLDDIHEHRIYVHDETSLKPYCASVSLYPFLFEGTKSLGGSSGAPKNIDSFCGSFVNLMYQLASNFAGAVATVEFLMYFDYFARKTYGEAYLGYSDTQYKIKQHLQGIVYSMNEPAAARGNQSVFWNISVFDKYYFESLFGNFYFPDGTQPNWKSLEVLQDFFLEWFRKERTKALLTFPVVTAAMLVDTDTKEPMDENFEYVLSYQMSKGLSFFVYQSDSADSLASCCRLRNELADNDFSYSLGAGGVSTGSLQVITLNLNRIYQTETTFEGLPDVVNRVHCYLMAHYQLQLDYIKAGMLPAYTAGYINEKKQFLTIGINGAVEAAEYLGYEIGDNDDYLKFLADDLGLIKFLNKAAGTKYGVRFNTEFVPAESLGVKNAKWDKEDGFKVNRSCYNSYFYRVEDDLSILERLSMHGEAVSKHLDGGAAVHLNLEQLPTMEASKNLIRIAAKLGVPYWTTNVLSTICNDCGVIDPETLPGCKACGSKNVDYATRIIGYLKRITDFSSERQHEHARRNYMKTQKGAND